MVAWKWQAGAVEAETLPLASGAGAVEAETLPLAWGAGAVGAVAGRAIQRKATKSSSRWWHASCAAAQVELVVEAAEAEGWEVEVVWALRTMEAVGIL